MKKSKYIYAFLLLFGATSCADMLDRFRKSEYAHYIFTFTITGRSSRKQSIKIIRCTPQFLFIIIIGLWR